MGNQPEFNVEKHIAQLREGATESWNDALYLVKGKRIFLGLFAAHLAIEKALKVTLSGK
jgi:hypothetical protein